MKIIKHLGNVLAIVAVAVVFHVAAGHAAGKWKMGTTVGTCDSTAAEAGADNGPE